MPILKIHLGRFLRIILMTLCITVMAGYCLVEATPSSDLQSILNNTSYYDGATGGSTSTCGATSTVTLTGDSNAQELYNYFISVGLTASESSGILGNLEAESSIQPERLENTASGVATPSSSLSSSQLSDTTIGWGIAQWTPPDTVITPISQSGGDPDDLGTQASYLWKELTTSEQAFLDNMKTLPDATPEQAAYAFEEYFERPASLDDAPVREAFAEAFYQQFVNDVPLPPALQITSNGGGGSCSNGGSPSFTSTTGYENPLRDVSGLTPLRIDQGVDYEGTGPVYAMGDGTVISVNTTDSGWPGLGTSCTDGTPPCNGAFIKYKLTDGPAAGDYVYFAEDCRPVVTPGETLTVNTVICNMYEGGTNIETGWTTAAAGEATLAQAQYIAGGQGNYATSAGQNFSALLKSLQAPPGLIQGNAAPDTLAGYPSWQ